MNWFCDIVLVGIIALTTFFGVKRGFVKTFFGLFGTVISLIVALYFLTPVADWLDQNYVKPFLTDYFLQEVSEEAMLPAEEIDFSALPDGAVEVFRKFGVDAEELAAILAESGKKIGAEFARWLAAGTVSVTSDVLSRAVAFLALFTASKIVILLLSLALNAVAKLPGLRLSNRLLGFACGLLEGIVIALVLSALLQLLQPMIRGSDSVFLRDFSIEKTYLVRFFLQWSPVKLLSA